MKRLKAIVATCAMLMLCTTAVLAAEKNVDTVQYVGNTKSRVYHNSKCRFFNCKDCNVKLASPQEAQAKGFKACSKCGG